MGRVDRGEVCLVVGCSEKAERSLNREKVSSAGLQLKEGSGRVLLCHRHYKEWKKSSKRDRKIERARFG